MLWWIFYSKWRKYWHKHWLIISINFVNRQIIIPALCQSDCQIPNKVSTKHVHSSSEAWYHESEMVLCMLPCRCTIIKAIIIPLFAISYDVTCQTMHGSTDSIYSVMKLEKLGTDVYLQIDFNTIVVKNDYRNHPVNMIKAVIRAVRCPWPV